ncbi:glycosyltransferase [Nannocystis sp. SCPEA4]|uniref:glycosyltransferase n=1 Tax=Nannocystis sp. SCPEA4 TaxID=2996787 RepID=UPI00226DF91A|nr:glycosyltransferase [Nannocystis sp. SCPEA4]
MTSTGASTRATPPPWLRRVAILNDYARIPYANGSSFASQMLRREFAARGQEVTVIGPNDPGARPDQLPPRRILLPSLPLRNHPGVYMPFPSARSFREAAAQKFDFVLSQSNHDLCDLGVWLRFKHDVPLLCVNTLHLPSVYGVVLSDRMRRSRTINGLFEDRLMPWLEHHCAEVYNLGDGLIVLAEGLVDYWRERGVTVPIHVIPRAVAPHIFDAPGGADPFPAGATAGQRLLVVCRHSREKGVERLLRLFARHVAPARPQASLTLVGDGPDHDDFRALADRLGLRGRVQFVGEVPVTDVPNWYRHADLFVYTSLSETYGQVVSEAMWCGLAAVAFADGMGVSQQIRDGRDGFLVPPGPDPDAADAAFGARVVELLGDEAVRKHMSEEAARHTHERAAPERSVARYYQAFEAAREHCRSTAEARRTQGLNTPRLISRWLAVHGAVVGLSALRPPALLNRNGGEQPAWS